MSRGQKRGPFETFSAVCGLFCPGCTLYIGTTEEPERLAGIAARFGVDMEDARCRGCRSEVRSFYCRTCGIVQCADGRGIPFCSLCEDYPCGMLREFQAQRPHRAELFADGDRIREVGYERWHDEKFAEYSCEKCSTINSAYDLACRRCGHEPGSPFAGRHRENIAAALRAISGKTD